MRKIDGEARTIQELLSGARYSTDYYQREYRWQTKQVVELMDDLVGRFQEEYEPNHLREAVEGYGHYFLGSIIISHKNSQNYIIDGQQSPPDRCCAVRPPLAFHQWCRPGG